MKKLLIAFLPVFLFTCKCYSQINIDTASFVKDNKQLYAITVSKNDKIVYQNFFNGKTDQDIFNDQSLTKSICSLLIGIAIDKGYIKSVDEKIVKFFPELQQDTDKRKQTITIRQIMNQASGLWHETLGANGNIGEYLSFPDPSGYVLKAPLGSEPGKVFQYSNAASHLLSVIITKSTGMSTLAFANKYLFGPMNIKNVRWEKMNDGYYDGCGLKSLFISTADMNKIGTLLLHKGRYMNKSILSANWVHQILNPSIYYTSNWGFPVSTYALCFYHYTYQGVPVTYGLGWGGQYVFIIPGKNTVIAVNESVNDITAIKAADTLLDKIFPLIFKQLN
jgi:CubicO group peptidase (beta-lactamase class C family)